LPKDKLYDLIIIGGGQSAMACAYFLRRTGLNYLILDDQDKCGGAWRHTWESLTLFSPAEQSSLPGWLMPPSKSDFPTRNEVIDYLCRYEQRYAFPIARPIKVTDVVKEQDVFLLSTNQGKYRSRTVISATGTWHNPFIPAIPGRKSFEGTQLHSSRYQNPDSFTGKKTLVVGEGNSGAQILAEVSKVAKSSWATARAPQFLPDDVDGRVLFDVASAKYFAEKRGEVFDDSKYNLGSIVMVTSVKDARRRDALNHRGSVKEIYQKGVVWDEGSAEEFDAIIWCTGFGFATDHLRNIVEPEGRGKIRTKGTRCIEVPGLWLVGYGQWTGFASATLIGVGRSGKQTVKEIVAYLAS
jgi:putative flavoprotein involved in K+ transport